ncbi:hypothetical protein NDA01_17765 [Trichocoleus desertorum AS-A10]|uniref:hypothetical protein n=1 Tax=Trichocoleus desertorum TaxID=1481672 RepID=UPI003299F450
MKQHPLVAASLLVVTLGTAQAAQADDTNLDFSLSANQLSSPAVLHHAEQPAIAIAPPPEVAGSSELSFALAPTTTTTQAQTSQPAPTVEPPAASSSIVTAAQSAPVDAASLFTGGANSLVAKAVGSAEGTRTPAGDRTSAYYGHVDPGNGVWNLGSFSYQHGARSPEEADEKQLKRLAKQTKMVRQQAAAKGMQLTLEEELNAIDLANQAPLAALDRGGYIDWLEAAHKMGLRGSEAVLWARTRSFLNPNTGQWNAPGLGNNVYSISSDQERRQQAIAKAIALHQQQFQRAETAATPPKPAETVAAAPPPTPEEVATQIIFQDLNP